jgi:hypothetical protein
VLSGPGKAGAETQTKENTMSENTKIDHSKKAPAFIAHTVRDTGDNKSFWSRVVLMPPSND